MISVVIQGINEELTKLFDKAKIYGLANSVIRVKGTEQELLPGVIDHNGEVEYVGVDDTHHMVMYHKANSISSALSTVQRGFGDGGADQVNTYANSLIVFLDRKKVKKIPDEIYLYLQSVFPESLNIKPFKTVNIRFTNVILNSLQVYSAEYQGTPYKLPPEKNLFAINYTVESIFKKGCFDKCL